MAETYFVASLNQVVSVNDTKIIAKSITKRLNGQPILFPNTLIRVYKPTGEQVFDKELNQLFNQRILATRARIFRY